MPDNPEGQSGDGVTNPNSSGEGNRQVSFESYQRALSQLKNTKAKYTEMEQKLNELIADKKAADDALLVEQNRFKELYEGESQKRQILEQQIAERDLNALKQRKRDAVASHIGSVHKPEFLEFIRIDEVDLENPDSIEAEANRFRSEYPMVLKTSTGNTHTQVPPGDTSLTPQSKSVNKMTDEELDNHFATTMRDEHLKRQGAY